MCIAYYVDKQVQRIILITHLSSWRLGIFAIHTTDVLAIKTENAKPTTIVKNMDILYWEGRRDKTRNKSFYRFSLFLFTSS